MRTDTRANDDSVAGAHRMTPELRAELKARQTVFYPPNNGRFPAQPELPRQIATPDIYYERAANDGQVVALQQDAAERDREVEHAQQALAAAEAELEGVFAKDQLIAFERRVHEAMSELTISRNRARAAHRTAEDVQKAVAVALREEHAAQVKRCSVEIARRMLDVLMAQQELAVAERGQQLAERQLVLLGASEGGPKKWWQDERSAELGRRLRMNPQAEAFTREEIARRMCEAHYGSLGITAEQLLETKQETKQP